jgi:UDP-N-acetylmuramyl pentapeptide synthase
MSELGKQSAQLHREVGILLQFSRLDHFFFIGGETLPMREALQARGMAARQMHTFEKKDDLRRALDGMEGVFFLKGSRIYGLETLVDFGHCQLIE